MRRKGTGFYSKAKIFESKFSYVPGFIVMSRANLLKGDAEKGKELKIGQYPLNDPRTLLMGYCLISLTVFLVKWGWEAGGRCGRSLKAAVNRDASISQIQFTFKDLIGKIYFIKCQNPQLTFRIQGSMFILNVRDMNNWNVLPIKRIYI